VTIIISGATGFIGSNLVNYFLEQKESVVALVREKDFDSITQSHKSLHVLEIESLNTQKFLNNVMSIYEPSKLFHAATKFIPSHESDDIPSLISSNILFGSQLLESMYRVNSSARFINICSAWQHYEGVPRLSKSLYAATKNAFQEILAFYTNSLDVASCNAVLFDTYGNNDTRKKIMQLLVEAALSESPIDLSSGNQMINLTHVNEICLALDIISNQETLSHIYQVSSRDTLTVRELASTIEVTLGLDILTRWGSRSDRQYEMLFPWKIADVPAGWCPKVSLAQGIQMLANSVKINFNK